MADDLTNVLNDDDLHYLAEKASSPSVRECAYRALDAERKLAEECARREEAEAQRDACELKRGRLLDYVDERDASIAALSKCLAESESFRQEAVHVTVLRTWLDYDPDADIPVATIKAEIQELEAALAKAREALRAMLRTHGMHGPCKQNSCGGCDDAYKKAKAALAEIDPPIPPTGTLDFRSMFGDWPLGLSGLLTDLSRPPGDPEERRG